MKYCLMVVVLMVLFLAGCAPQSAEKTATPQANLGPAGMPAGARPPGK
jgi:hypothetical protein